MALDNDFNWGLPQLSWTANPDWRDDPDRDAARVVADAQNPLAGVLVRDERFQLVYEDSISRVFVRRQTGSVSP